MNIRKIFLSLIVLFSYCLNVNAQAGCTDPAATNYNPSATINDGSCIYPVTHTSPLLRAVLPVSIPESSGLILTDGKLWTHNDSGNPPDLFSIDTTTGQTLQTVIIDNFPNTDWEDISADSSYIYIGNFGNNHGDRTDLEILKIKKSDIGSATTVHVNAESISFAYTDQTSFTASNTNNFDCESLISIKDSLYIFTKDRGDHETRVYKLPKTPGNYNISPYTSYNVNGLITGASYDPVNNEVALIGYLPGHTYSFLWFLSDFQGDLFFSGNKRRIEISNGKEWQTEGVSFISNRRFFVSCESTDSIPASLFVSDENWVNALEITTEKINEDPAIYPNPSGDLLHIDNVHTIAHYNITNYIGQVVQCGTLNEGHNIINLSSG